MVKACPDFISFKNRIPLLVCSDQDKKPFSLMSSFTYFFQTIDQVILRSPNILHIDLVPLSMLFM